MIKKISIIFIIFCFVLFCDNISYVPVGHWSYQALEKLAVFGIINMEKLSRKPLRRDEIKKLVEEIIEKIKNDEVKIGYDQYDIEITILKLKKEFIDEDNDKIKGEFKIIYTDREDLNLGNQKGHHWDEKLNFNLSLNKSFNFSENFNITLTPSFYLSSDDYDLPMEEFYCIYLFKNWEFSFGRFSQWWGPGYHGSLLLTDNPFPFTSIKITNYESISLPWFFEKLGPFYYTFFITRLESDRDIPNPYITGHRWEINPFSFLTIGFSRNIMLGGEGRNYQLSPSNYFQIFFNPKKTEESGEEKLNTNQLYSWDFKLRVKKIDKFIPFLCSDLLLYGEFGREAVTGKVYNLLWTPQAVITGIYIPGIFKIDGLDFRFEYADTYPVSASGNWYQHRTYTNGYTYYGDIIGHHMGTNARDYYFKISKQLNENWKISLEYDKEKHNLDLPNPSERNTYGIILNYEDLKKDINWEFGYTFIDEENENNNFFYGVSRFKF